MTPRDLRNIHTTRNSCRDALPCANMTQKIPLFITADGEASWWLLPSSILLLVTIMWCSATTKHLFQYPQCDRSGLRKPKKDKHQHYSRLPPAFILLVSNDLTINPDSVITNLIGKDGCGAGDVKHLPHKIFLSWHHH